MKPSSKKISKADILVIGSGAAGMAAALTAVEGGAKVIVFEKMRHHGGTSNFAQGMFAVESNMQQQKYIGLTRDEAFKTAMNYSHWRANPRLVRAIIDKSASTIAWLQSQGVEFIEPVTMFYDAPRTWHILKGKPRAGGRGSAMIRVLVARAKGKGVDLRLATPIKKILREGNRITGVVAEQDGKDINMITKAVIIATGGYANNKEWVKKYSGFDLDVNLYPIGNINKMGDGIRMAWEVGAAGEGMGVLQLWRGILIGQGVKELGNLNAAALQPHLWVNQDGERFCDETIANIDPFEGNASARQKNGYSYTLFDEAIRRHMMEKGIDKNMGTENPPGTRLVHFDAELKVALGKKNPHLFVANSMEELAGKIGVNPAVLKATVKEYNEFCQRGHDDLFAKDRQYLRTIKEPKFYAMRCVTMTLGTLGGIKINHKTEVLDKEEKIIPGLYAAGNDASGMYGDSYNIYLSGGTLGFAVNSGRIAGENALNYIGKKRQADKGIKT
jgi:fumarate reductase flavoprotein subunit